MKHITTEDALRALEEAVAEKGEDYRYVPVPFPIDDDDEDPVTQCAYVYAGAPSCLIGHALHRLGAPLNLLAAHEGDSAETFATSIKADNEAWSAFREAQKAQDLGKTWGEALRVAREAVTP